MTLNRERINI